MPRRKLPVEQAREVADLRKRMKALKQGGFIESAKALGRRIAGIMSRYSQEVGNVQH